MACSPRPESHRAWLEEMGRRIEGARRKRGVHFTRRRVALRAGVPESSLSYIERGLREPGAYALARIAFAVGASLEELLPPLYTAHPDRSPAP